MERFDTKEMIFREEQYLRQKEMGQELRHNLELKELKKNMKKGNKSLTFPKFL